MTDNEDITRNLEFKQTKGYLSLRSYISRQGAYRSSWRPWRNKGSFYMEKHRTTNLLRLFQLISGCLQHWLISPIVWSGATMAMMSCFFPWRVNCWTSAILQGTLTCPIHLVVLIRHIRRHNGINFMFKVVKVVALLSCRLKSTWWFWFAGALRVPGLEL